MIRKPGWERALSANRHKNKARGIRGMPTMSNSLAFMKIGEAKSRAKERRELTESEELAKPVRRRRISPADQIQRMNALESDYKAGRISRSEYEQRKKAYIDEYVS